MTASSRDDRLEQEGIMKTTEHKLRQLIREELMKEYGGMPMNGLPDKSSPYYDMAKKLDIGTMDLDNIAYDLGFRDFRDMERTIDPKKLAERDPESFAVAVQDSSIAGASMGPNEILELVGAEGRVY